VGVKGVYRTRQREWVARFVQLEYEHKYRRMGRLPSIDFIDTYSAAYRRDAFLHSGGFDEAYTTASVEDQELSFRLAREGYRLVFVPQAAVYHRHNTTLAQYARRKFGIGYWKAFLLRRHPDRAVSDSHTPQTLKVQIGLMGLLCLAIPLAPFWPWVRWVALGLAALFVLAAAPLLALIARRDPPVLLLAPWLLAARSLTSGMGLAAGTVRFWLRPHVRSRSTS
jgi:cellulose synthase/poly-beta-1,6-N-acetylglucosamine synthase-like glycosyltransferase